MKGTKCPFRATISLDHNNVYYVKRTRNLHNHDVGEANLRGDPTYRRDQREAHSDTIHLAVERLSGLTTMTCRQIALYLSGDLTQIDEPVDSGLVVSIANFEEIEGLRRLNLPITDDDVRNIQRALKATKYGTHSSTKLFIDLLERYREMHGVDYFIDWIPDDSGGGRRPGRVFWTYKWCLEMWKNNPEVLLFDNTY
jgi:hypothetical protein